MMWVSKFSFKEKNSDGNIDISRVRINKEMMEGEGGGISNRKIC